MMGRRRRVDRRRPGRKVFVVRERRRPRWRRWFPVIVSILLAITAPILAYGQPLPDSVTIGWTDTGDDGMTGTATTTEVRMSTSPITSSNWSQATVVPGAPTPGLAGTVETMVVRGLINGTIYYFAVRLSDEAGNWSDLSNVIRWDWNPDTTPPAIPLGVGATHSGGSIQLSWTANGETDLAGYNVYRSGVSGGPYTRINSTLVTGPSLLDSSLPPSGSVWYGVRAMDQSGNESGMSTPIAAAVREDKGIRIFAVYPNPSSVSTPVTIPLRVTGGAMRLDILDAGRRHVRGYPVASLSEQFQDIVWDGKNQAGRPVAPGVYTAVLRGPGYTGASHIVKVP